MTRPTPFAGQLPGPPVFVLDAVVAVDWGIATRATAYSDDVMFKLAVTVAVVPAGWTLDVAAGLLAAEARGKCPTGRTDSVLRILAAFTIHVDDETDSRAWGDTLALARAHSISLPKAAYLELALRTRLPLATADKALRKAATSAGASLYSP